MARIERGKVREYGFDWEKPPVLRVHPGESFELETEDASTG